jgi:hypothetical protein
VEEWRYSSVLPNLNTRWKLKRMKWAGHVAQMGKVRNAYKILVRKPEER